MLTHLRITGFALLDDVTLDLGPGLNVLTGETGAGKSLLVDAVALLRGGRASAEVVRAGAEEARIEAVFEPEGAPAEALRARLVAAGTMAEDEAIPEEGMVVRRVIPRAAAGTGTGTGGGRRAGRVYVNGGLSTAQVLAEVGGGLIDLAGQHEHQTLTDSARHLALLDAFAVAPSLVEAMAARHGALQAAASALAALTMDERARAEREDFLRFQLRELDEAELRAGEDEELRRDRERLKSAEKLHGSARRAEGALYSREGSIVEELSQMARDLAETGRSDPALAALAKQVEEARVTLEDAAESLRRYADHMHADPERLAEVDDRLHVIGKLVRKHGSGAPDDKDAIAHVIARRDAMREELARLGSHEERRGEAERALEAARTEAGKAAKALRAAREKAAEGLSRKVSEALGALGMSGARLVAQVSDRAAREGDEPAMTFDGRRLAPTGWDRAEFLLAANPGEEPRPLARVASGGELSRIMLALKQVLARTDTIATYVFDEVDTGIGGQVADVVGQRLKATAADKQVLCVTHLPQIAAWADCHFHVEKHVKDGRTATVVRRLSREERVEELARMVGGAKVTPKARAHAEEMIRSAGGSGGKAARG